MEGIPGIDHLLRCCYRHFIFRGSAGNFVDRSGNLFRPAYDPSSSRSDRLRPILNIRHLFQPDKNISASSVCGKTNCTCIDAERGITFFEHRRRLDGNCCWVDAAGFSFTADSKHYSGFNNKRSLCEPFLKKTFQLFFIEF